MRKAYKFLIPIAVVLFVVFSLLIKTDTTASEPSSNWTSMKTVEAKNSSSVIEVTLISHKLASEKDDTVSINKMRRIKGSYPSKAVVEKGSNWKLEIVGSDKAVLSSMEFMPNHETEVGPPMEKHALKPPLYTDDITFTYNLQDSAKADAVRVVSPSGAVVSSKKLAGIEEFSPTKDYFTTNTNSNPLSTFDFTILGSGYTDLAVFQQRVEYLRNKILKTEPFKSRASQITYNYVLSPTNLHCCEAGGTCNAIIARQIVNDAGAPGDNIVVIQAGVAGGSATAVMGGGVSFLTDYTTVLDSAVHEIGHSLAMLYDAYMGIQGGPMLGTVQRNCYAGDPPAPEWVGIVPDMDYVHPCLHVNWWRLGDDIMSGPNGFNVVSQKLVNEAIDTFAGPPQPNSISPSVSITSPKINEVIEKQTYKTLSVSTTDDLGVVRVEYWLDGKLADVSYDGILNRNGTFNFSHGWESHYYASGPHQLVAKAYDLSGNVGVSAPVNFTLVGESGDITPPSVTFKSPVNNGIVDGAIDIEVYASDSGNQIQDVTLKYNDQFVIGKAVADMPNRPYKIRWDTTGYEKGTYTLTAIARDAAGNQKEATITVDLKQIVVLQLSADKEIASHGEEIQYTLTYKNDSPNMIYSAYLSNVIPENTTYVEGSGSEWGWADATYDPESRTLNWEGIGSLTPGYEITQKFRVRVN